MILTAAMLVLLGRSASCCSLLLMISSADGTGTDVNNALTSYDVMHSSSSSFVFLISSMNSLELLTWCSVDPSSGFIFLANSLATPYVTEPMLDTMGLRGCFSHEFWVAHRILVQLLQLGTFFCMCCHPFLYQY